MADIDKNVVSGSVYFVGYFVEQFEYVQHVGEAMMVCLILDCCACCWVEYVFRWYFFVALQVMGRYLWH